MQNAANQSLTLASLESDGVVLRLLALAMDKVQRRRRKPAKKGRLHRV
jgi:hypothetical protein